MVCTSTFAQSSGAFNFKIKSKKNWLSLEGKFFIMEHLVYKMFFDLIIFSNYKKNV